MPGSGLYIIHVYHSTKLPQIRNTQRQWTIKLRVLLLLMRLLAALLIYNDAIADHI